MSSIIGRSIIAGGAGVGMVFAEIPKCRMRGDVDGDGKITQDDATLIAKATAHMITLTGADLWCADVDADGDVTSSDTKEINTYLKGKPNALTTIPTFADYYNNWTYHKVNDTSGYWTTELSIPDITVEMAVSVICGGNVRAGTFIKVETFSGGVRIYANYPPIEALPCTVSYSAGAGGQFIIADTGVSETYVQDAISSVGAKYVMVTLTASGWGGGKEQIVSVPGVKTNSMEQLIIPTPYILSTGEYYSAGIRISARADDELTFSCDTIPTTDIFVVLVIIPIVGKFE